MCQAKLRASLPLHKSIISCIINNLTLHDRLVIWITAFQVLPSPLDLRACLPLPSFPSRSSLGIPGPQAAVVGPQEVSPQTGGARYRHAVLGLDSLDLVWLEAVTQPGEHGDYRSVAPRRLPKHLSLTNCDVSAKSNSRQSACDLDFQSFHANRHRSRFASTS